MYSFTAIRTSQTDFGGTAESRRYKHIIIIILLFARLRVQKIKYRLYIPNIKTNKQKKDTNLMTELLAF